MSKPNLYVSDKPITLGAWAVFPYSDKLFAKFWAEDKYTKEQFNLSRKQGTNLLVPRELAINGHYGKDLRKSGPKVVYGKGDPQFGFRNDEQKRVFEESTSLLKQGRSHIIKCPTRFGKTVVASRIIREVGLKTLVIVTKEDLLGEKQWFGALKRFAGVPEEKIGLIRQDKCEYKGKTVVLAMVHSLTKEGKYPPEIFEEFGLVVWDEVHHMAAETFQRTGGLFNCKLRLGLSAGASNKKDEMRSDGKDFVFEAHIGPVAVESKFVALSPKVLVIETPYKLPMVNRRVNGSWKTVPLPHEPGKMGHITVDMAKHPARNKLLVTLAFKAYQKGRYVVVFSDLARDKHLDNLREMLIKEGVPPSEISFYVGGMKEAAREEAKEKHIILATYGMMAEATDIPWLDTCILGTPRSNIKQAAGRVLTEHEGKQRPVIFDLVDYDSKVCQQYFISRHAWYTTKDINAEVVKVSL